MSVGEEGDIMISMDNFKGTPMCKALTDMAEEMERQGMPPVELNVIGGFALMLRGYRDLDSVTDIDYVGAGLPEKLDGIIRQVGLKHNMEPGWINNDGMLTGNSMDDFELSTGKLHFENALQIGKMAINVLDEEDLLRLKLISVDTAMTELEATGDFARRKDFADIEALMHAQGMGPEAVEERFGRYILCKPDTMQAVCEIYENGHEKAIETITEKCHQVRDMQKNFAGQARSPFLENLMDSLMGSPQASASPFGNLSLSEEDLQFARQETSQLSL